MDLSRTMAAYMTSPQIRKQIEKDFKIPEDEFLETLYIDIETFSGADLKKTGVYKYAEDPDFRVLLFAYAIDDDEVEVIDMGDPVEGRKLPPGIVSRLNNPRILKVAHNAAFERVCLSRYLRDELNTDPERTRRLLNLEPGESFHYLKPEGWYCTMVHASICGLPSSLKMLGQAIGLAEDEQKLETGNDLIKYFCQPCNPTKVNGGRVVNLPWHAPEKWADFVEYNRQDVFTEIQIENRLNAIYTMPKLELQRYWLDQRISDLGIMIDMDLVNKVLYYGTNHKQILLDEVAKIAPGLLITSGPQVKQFIRDRTGIILPNLRKDTIPKAMKEIKDPVARRILQLKTENGKISITKYSTIKAALCEDGRIHGCLQFYGSRTGRWAGRLLQPQNLPRNAFDDFHEARQLVKDENWELLDLCYPSINDVFATLIRTALIPATSLFAVADYAAIEARVIAWLADETWRMNAFRDGKDIYCESAAMMFHVPVQKHGPNGHLRKQGKIAELALGYGGGIAALKAFHADEMGMTEADMNDIVDKWRAASPKICGLWYQLGDMLDALFMGPKTSRQTGRQIADTKDWFPKPQEGPHGLRFASRSGVLEVRLPSGRCLIYQKPRYAKKPDGRWNFCFDGLNQTTHKWEQTFTWGGKMVENIIQAIARDCLALTIDRIYEAGRLPVLHIHDEVVVEVDKPEDLNQLLEIMARPIEWAPGLELKGAGFTSAYYMKD